MLSLSSFSRKTINKKKKTKINVKFVVLTAGEGVQQRGVRGSCRGRTVLLFGFADLGVALGKFQPDRLRDVRIESHTLFFFTQFFIFQIVCVCVCVCV